MAAVVENPLMRSREFGVGEKIVPGVGVAIVARKIARRDFEAQAMPGLEQMARRP
jgi:hypothetical protein